MKKINNSKLIKFFIVLICSLHFACSKQEMNTKKIAGAYDVLTYTKTWLNKDGGVDSSSTIENAGWWGFYDSDNSSDNLMSSSSTFIPKSIQNFFLVAGGSTNLSWQTDKNSIKTLTIYRNVTSGNIPNVRYTIVSRVAKKMTLSYVETKNGVLRYKELIELKRR